MSQKSILFFKKRDTLKSKLDFSAFSKIVPVDYESATHLDSLKISYILPETYVSMKEYWEIDHLAIQLGNSLWNLKNKELISFKKINIPELFHLEDTITLIKLMKKIFEYSKIIDAETPDEIIATVDGNTFDDIPKFLALERKIKYNTLNTISQSISHFDNVPIQIKLGGKIFSINQNQFKKIKDFGETITKKLPQKKLTTNPLLLVDFNLVLYEEFIETLEKNGINVVLLNSRRPSIWNKKSLKIQLSKKYNIEYLSNYFDKESKEIVNSKTEEITTNFLSIIRNDEFSSKFKIKNIGFYDIIHNEFSNYFPQKIYESVKNIETSSKLLNHNFSRILLWAYQLPFEKILMNLGSQTNIPISVLQDGVKGRFYDPTFGVMENYTDYDSNFQNLFVWGKDSQKYFLNVGIPQNKIILSGSPLYDKHFTFKPNLKITNTILFTSSGLGLSLDSNTVSRIKKYESFIDLLCRTIPEQNHKNLVIKLHPFADERVDIAKIAKNINPEIQVYKYENIIDLINNADLVISSYSTVLLESMILGKPTMTWLDDDYYESPDLRYIESGASLKLDFKNFKKQIDDFYNNLEISKTLLNNSNNFKKDYLENHGNASMFLADFFKNS